MTPQTRLLRAALLAAVLGAPLAATAQSGLDYTLTGGPASASAALSSAPLAGGEYQMAGQIALVSAPAAQPVQPAGPYAVFLPLVRR